MHTDAHGHGLSCRSVLQLKCREHQTSSRCATSEKGRGGGQCLSQQSCDKSCSRICREKCLTLCSVTFLLNMENNPSPIWLHLKIRSNQISKTWNYSNLNGCFSQPDLRIGLTRKFQLSIPWDNQMNGGCFSNRCQRVGQVEVLCTHADDWLEEYGASKT